PILYRDADVLAFDKPAGIAVHPGSGHPLENTALGALLSLFRPTGGIFRPAFVGRLDRDASGVLLAGVSPKGLRGLEALSRSREISKTYIALAAGRPIPNAGVIDTPLADAACGPARMRSDDGGARAVTEYRVLARGVGTLLEIRLKTGRRHQIRAHFKAIGAPIAGDVRYGDAAWNSRLKRSAGLRRLFLHCTETTFTHPLTARKLRIVSHLPKELARTLHALDMNGS
ncbi:MAG TPA: RluA family pseudouridine synthase, partial [Planctomycetes bacterium]|nr:RluA family pseudouridine synthase [Planctomycetota bacterium]